MKNKYLVLLGICLIFCIYISNNQKNKEYDLLDNTKEIVEDNLLYGNVEQAIEPIYYGKTKQELIDHINKSLNSDLSNKGSVIVTYSIEYNVDPYLATAIMLHETGCKWECSNLVKKCNNVAGQKGSSSCNGGSYKRYDTLDDGIKGAIYNISINYIQKGLTTPEKMGPKYAASSTWASKINNYINEIKLK